MELSAIADTLAFDARGACSVDDDCVWAPTVSTCPSGTVVNACEQLILNSNAATFGAAWEMAAREACGMVEDDCDLMNDCISPPAARCVEGNCRL